MAKKDVNAAIVSLKELLSGETILSARRFGGICRMSWRKR